MTSRRRGRRASWLEAAEMLRRRDAFVALCLLDFAEMNARLDPSIEDIRRYLNLPVKS